MVPSKCIGLLYILHDFLHHYLTLALRSVVTRVTHGEYVDHRTRCFSSAESRSGDLGCLFPHGGRGDSRRHLPIYFAQNNAIVVGKR